MSETELIRDEIDRATHGGAWHGPAVREALNGLSADDALARPITGAHTIWEIVLHMTAWAREVERRLREDAHPLDASHDWPSVTGASAADWDAAQSELFEAHRRLRLTIREFPSQRLGQPVPGPSDEPGHSSFYIMLHGLAQHDAYHSGQIAILKRALATTSEPVGTPE